ncbi:hypothetical protein OUZ56_015347 [Daphnia magna]|uniref:Uncharacterized protein n=1 Tax=Daphnia magna TaxID=35525 RepID=A0ABR0AMJ9_9CRUS|nr:hypothetical protein OUZ56_015347 [Daphnia magna]
MWHEEGKFAQLLELRNVDTSASCLGDEINAQTVSSFLHTSPIEIKNRRNPSSVLISASGSSCFNGEQQLRVGDGGMYTQERGRKKGR